MSDECPYCPQLAAEIKRYHASNAALLEACESMVANINSWLATGVPADAQESEILYSQMVAAIAKAKGES